jgi:hypothetical protein
VSDKLCDENLDVNESQCKGLSTYRDTKSVIITKDSCYKGCYKMLHRKTRVFPDESSLVFDEVLICADEKLLVEIMNAIKEEFD